MAHLNLEKWDSDDELQMCPINLSTHLSETTIKHASLSIGDELFIPSLFIGRVGDRNPVLRVANLAAMDDEPVWGGSPSRPAYLVETRSLGGTSGSPVFLNVYPRRIINRGSIPTDPVSGVYEMPYLLIGMFIGTHSGQYHGDFVVDDDAPEVSKDVDFNAGISIVLPIVQVLEVLNQPAMKDARRATIEAKRKQSGYRPA